MTMLLSTGCLKTKKAALRLIFDLDRGGLACGLRYI